MRKNNRKGQGLVEYALVLALIALTCVLALSNMGNEVISGMLSNIKGNLSNAENTINAAPPPPSSGT